MPIGQEHLVEKVVFPTPLTQYPPAQDSLLATLSDRIAVDPFNAVATIIFVLAIVHTFMASRVANLAHHVQHGHDERLRAQGLPPSPSVRAEFLHFLGEVEVVFGLWALALVAGLTVMRGWTTAKYYLNDTVVYAEPLFVVVIMALAASRPIIVFAEGAMRKVASFGGATPAAWWIVILTVGPILGSFITEPAAMTICALLLARQFYDLEPGMRLKYATIGLLFVNISIGGTLTHFAAPPVLMVSRVWQWDTAFMMGHFGWRTLLAVAVSTGLYYVAFRRELSALALKRPPPTVEIPERDTEDERPDRLLPVPVWLIAVHMAFMAWTVANSHYPPLFIGGFLFFLGFAKATAAYQSRIELKSPLLVGFFLAGLVIHGGLQGWWIAPVLASLDEQPLYFGAMLLTAFNDNALITFLATLVPDFGGQLRLAVVEGALAGGGLTVIANAPNPAGQALLSRFFGGAIAPLYLLLGALVPTAVATFFYRVI